ncbi:MAG TPA: hypothetical protein VKX25_13250 [Bryobacteraceae bacterium]|nr:hypothetical protein [Bryobacteraceae bacterium]
MIPSPARHLGTLALLLVQLCRASSGEGQLELCTEQENTLFTTLLVNKKIASVCASTDLSQKSGYFVYRYGEKINSIELSIPKRPTEFRQFVTVAERTNDANLNDAEFVRFRNGDFSYVIYYAIGANLHLSGLAVFKGEKLVKAIPSVPGTFDTSLALNGLLDLGIPYEDETTEQRIWKALLPASSAVHSRRRAAGR